MLAEVGLFAGELLEGGGLIFEQVVGREFAAELALEAGEGDVFGDAPAGGQAGVVPDLLEEVVIGSERVGVDVAVLDDEAGDAVRLGEYQAYASKV